VYTERVPVWLRSVALLYDYRFPILIRKFRAQSIDDAGGRRFDDAGGGQWLIYVAGA